MPALVAIALWYRLTSPPAWSYSIVPDEWLPAIDSAWATCSGGRPSSLLATAVTPNGPTTPWWWNPSSTAGRDSTRPMRYSTS